MERKYSRDWIWQIKSNLHENQSWNQREIREKVRNLKDSYKKDKENNRKSGSIPEFPSFFFNLDEVLSDRAVVKLPEVKLDVKEHHLPVGRVVDQKKVLNFHFHFQREIISLVSGMKLQMICVSPGCNII